MYKLNLVKITQAQGNQIITLLEPQLIDGNPHHIVISEIGLAFTTPQTTPSFASLDFYLFQGAVSSLRNKITLPTQTFEEISDLLFYCKDKKVLPFGTALKVVSSGLAVGEEVNLQIFFDQNYDPSITELLESL